MAAARGISAEAPGRRASDAGEAAQDAVGPKRQGAVRGRSRAQLGDLEWRFLELEFVWGKSLECLQELGILGNPSLLLELEHPNGELETPKVN